MPPDQVLTPAPLQRRAGGLEPGRAVAGRVVQEIEEQGGSPCVQVEEERFVSRSKPALSAGIGQARRDEVGVAVGHQPCLEPIDRREIGARWLVEDAAERHAARHRSGGGHRQRHQDDGGCREPQRSAPRRVAGGADEGGRDEQQRPEHLREQDRRGHVGVVRQQAQPGIVLIGHRSQHAADPRVNRDRRRDRAGGGEQPAMARRERRSGEQPRQHGEHVRRSDAVDGREADAGQVREPVTSGRGPVVAQRRRPGGQELEAPAVRASSGSLATASAVGDTSARPMQAGVTQLRPV